MGFPFVPYVETSHQDSTLNALWSPIFR